MYCEKCGSYVEGDSKFCPVCGAAVNAAASQDAAANPDSPSNPALQDECMKCLYKHFRHEKLVWMICGIVLTVCCVIMIFCGVVLAANGAYAAYDGYSAGDFEINGISRDIHDNISGPAAVINLVAGSYILMSGLLFLPIGIINLVMIGKTQRYINGLYKDCGEAVKRASSVGMIVFSALFNEIAMIFIIINFVNARRHRAVFEEVRKLQLSAADSAK